MRHVLLLVALVAVGCSESGPTDDPADDGPTLNGLYTYSWVGASSVDDPEDVILTVTLDVPRTTSGTFQFGPETRLDGTKGDVVVTVPINGSGTLTGDRLVLRPMGSPTINPIGREPGFDIDVVGREVPYTGTVSADGQSFDLDANWVLWEDGVTTFTRE